MDAIVAALASITVWGCAVGALIIAFLVARIAAGLIYKHSAKGKINLAAPIIVVLISGLALTFVFFLDESPKWLAAGAILVVAVLAVICMVVASRRESYHRARQAALVAVWLGVYIGYVVALAGGFAFGFTEEMLVATAALALLVPMIILAPLMIKKI